MFSYLYNYLLSLIIQATESNTIQDSLAPTIKLSFILTPLIYIWDRIINWTMNNQDYMIFVIIAILIDWATGSLKHLFIARNFDWGENAKGLITKLGLAAGGGFLFEGINYLIGTDNLVSDTLSIVTRLVVFLYPALSAWKNMHTLSGGKFPPKIWIDKSSSFYRTLNPKHFKNTEDEETNI